MLAFGRIADPAFPSKHAALAAGCQTRNLRNKSAAGPPRPKAERQAEGMSHAGDQPAFR